MGKLKITDEHFSRLKKLITEFCEDTLGSTIEKERENYLNQGFGVERFNFDICYAATAHDGIIWKEMYKYIDDSHIFSALKVITGTTGSYN